MKHAVNVIRFLIFLPVCLAIMYGLFYLIGLLLVWLIGFKTFWFVVTILFLGTAMVGLGSAIFGIIAKAISQINPYKKLGGWIVIPICILYSLFNIYLLWSIMDISQTKGIFTALFGSVLIMYCTIIFSSLISAENEEGYE